MVIEYLTAILVFVTAIYVYLTYRMSRASEASVAAMREQSEAMLRPYVTVTPYIRPHTPFLYIKINNLGKTNAENLSLTLDRDFYQFADVSPDNNLRSKSAFSNPIDSFPPGSELIFALGQSWLIFGEEADPIITPAQFEVTASYSYPGKNVEEVFRIDLQPYLGSEWDRDPIVEELERLRKVIEKK